MTQAGGTSEQTYQRLKDALLAGAVDSHSRLDIAELASMYDVSPTPVREAAMRLLGEGLLEAHPRGGARPLPVSEYRLRMLIELHGRIAGMALKWAGRPIAVEVGPHDAATEVAQRRLFCGIAEATENVDLIIIVERLSDRLAPFRRVEPAIFPNLAIEIEALRHATLSGSAADLRTSLRAYHRRRLAQVAQLAWYTARNQLDAAYI